MINNTKRPAMLIEWSHEQWELAIHNIDENSNIEQIIKLLPDI